jgi:hypothetical protein
MVHYTVGLYTMMLRMHAHCLSMQHKQGHVSGIEACAWNTFYHWSGFCYVRPVSNVALLMCRTNNRGISADYNLLFLMRSAHEKRDV